MAHSRKLIRHAVVALLTGATAAGARVRATRAQPNRKSQLPAIGVYTLRESVREDSPETVPREITRDVKVMIEGWVADSAAVPFDDAMDDLAEQIEAAFDADRYLGGEAADSVLELTEMDFDSDGDPVLGIVTLTYSVAYRTEPTTAALDDFLRAKATHQLADGLPDDTIPAADGPFTVQEIP